MKKKLLLGVAYGAIMGFTPAMAADLPIKAAPYRAPVVAPYNWTGFYAGGNIGYSWGTAKGELNTPDIAVSSPLYSNSLDLDGVIGGGQIGYNWQYDNSWVFGIEADLQASGEKGSSSASDPQASFCINDCEGLVTADLTRTLDAKILWFGTLRGRIGFLVTPGIMLYGTGGAAYGEVKVSGSAAFSASCVGLCPGAPSSGSASVSSSDVNWGWTAGAGIEGAFPDSPRWTWKVEYLYLDLGSLSGSSSNANWNADFTDNVVRVGVNYRFNGL